MPQYFTGLNPATAFSDGLMAGYEFVDRIKSRKRQLDLENRRIELAENADERASESHDLSMESGKYNLERSRVEDGREDEDRDFTISERNRAVERRGQNEAARQTLASVLTSQGPTWSSSDTIGGPNGVEQVTRGSPVAAPAAVPTAAPSAPAAAPAAAAPAGPVDLRVAQQQRDDAPGFIERVSAFATDLAARNKEGERKRTAESFWGEVANPNSTVGTSFHKGIGHSVPLVEVRRDPTKYAHQYLQDRDQVPAEARATLDLTMSNGLKERYQNVANEIKALDARDPRNAPKIKALTDRLIETGRNMDALSKAATASAARDAGITRPVKVDDERVVPAIINAAAKARETQPVIQTSPAELRAARTMVTRAQTGKRLNEKQIAALTTLYTNGEIGAEELNNWSKYGTPIAPKQPTIQALGGGYAAVISDAGISLMHLPGGEGKDKEASAASRSNIRLLNNDRLGEMTTRFKDLVENGDLSDGSVGAHSAKFLDFIKREGATIQTKTGMPLFDSEGALDLSAIDPAEWSQLMDAYATYDKEEVAGVPFIPTALTRDNKPFSEYVPGATGSQGNIIDLTGAFQ